MLELVDTPLSKKMFIEMNVQLKRGTSDESNLRYNVGGFKALPNIIGMMNVIHTTAPADVEKELDDLLKEYHAIKEISIQDIIDFHVRFERIHPFGDGRVGRMIMYKECLKNGCMPFVILDKDKTFYLRDLKEYDNQPNYLIETRLHAQDIYECTCKQLLNFDLDQIQGQSSEL